MYSSGRCCGCCHKLASRNQLLERRWCYKIILYSMNPFASTEIRKRIAQYVVQAHPRQADSREIPECKPSLTEAEYRRGRELWGCHPSP